MNISPGIKLGDFIPEMGANWRVLPTGVCKNVNAGGHLQSSSVGPFSRFFGLGMDHLEWIDVVTADGEITRASRTQNEDLFYALRGGGPGSYGVVTQYRLKPLDGARVGHVGIYFWPWSKERWLNVYDAWKNLMSDPKYSNKLFIQLRVYPHLAQQELSLSEKGDLPWINANVLYFDPE